MNSFCSFCASAGIKGPHDHFVKSSKAIGAKVVCPKLLATVCNFCNKTGHTENYCGDKREYNTRKKHEENLARRNKIDSGDWVETKVKAPAVLSTATKTNTTKLSGMFAALDMDDYSSSDDEDDCIECEPKISVTNFDQPKQSWASIVKTPTPVQDEDDDFELPPLVFGKKPVTRWGD